MERGARAALRGFGADLAAVLRHPVFASAVAGITLYTGALAAPYPRIGCSLRGLSPDPTHPPMLETHNAKAVCLLLGSLSFCACQAQCLLPHCAMSGQVFDAGQRQT